jgi:hypothetical protein
MRVEVKLGGWTVACDGQTEAQIDRMINLNEFITCRSSPKELMSLQLFRKSWMDWN